MKPGCLRYTCLRYTDDQVVGNLRIVGFTERRKVGTTYRNFYLVECLRDGDMYERGQNDIYRHETGKRGSGCPKCKADGVGAWIAPPAIYREAQEVTQMSWRPAHGY